MSLTVPMGTVALRLSTAAGDGRNGTWAEVAQAKELLQKFGSSGPLNRPESGTCLSPPSLNIHIYSD